MERRTFIRHAAGLGLIALPGVEVFSQTASSDFTIQQIITRGDIRRKQPPVAGTPWVLLYQGNGRLGSCAGPWGFHTNSNNKTDFSVHGATRFTHMKHYIRGKFNADYLLPAGFMFWENEPQQVTGYEQYQSFYDGTITTRFTTADYSVVITSWIDAVHKDIAGYQLDVKGNCPAIIVNTPRKLAAMYDQQ